MKIHSIRIENLRAFKDETILFDDYTCLVGPNGAGKSTVLCALNVFFRNAEGSSIDPSCLSAEDYHLKDTTQPVRITVTFEDLSADACEDLKDYYRGGKLIVTAEAQWTNDDMKGPVGQYGQRMAMMTFAPFFERSKLGAKADELKESYKRLRVDHPDLPAATVKADMEKALQLYEAERPHLCVAIPSTDQFYGFSKGVNKLQKYVQWVYIPAVKDASMEQVEAKNTALGRLLARTVRAKISFGVGLTDIREKAQQAYEDLLKGQQGALEQLSGALKSRIAEWAHPDANLRLEWRQDTDKSIKIEEPLAQIIAGEGVFEGDLLRFGHGLQRSFLLALLQELSSFEDVEGPRLVLGIEEPELYQHPPQARHLAAVLQKLSDSNTQVAICTHSPYFVSGNGFSNIRLVRKSRRTGSASVRQASLLVVENALAAALDNAKQLPRPQGLIAQIHQSLQPSLNEIFFTPTVILVEGLEDVAYVATYMHLMGLWDEFRRVGCHFIPVNGKEYLLRPLAIAKHMEIRTFTLCDSDSDPYAEPPCEGWNDNKKNNHRSAAIQHKRDNFAIQSLMGRQFPEGFIDNDLWLANLVMWKSNMGATFRSEISEAEFTKAFEATQSDYGHPKNMEKNSLAIADRLTVLWNAGHKSASLLKLCDKIIEFGCGEPLETSKPR